MADREPQAYELVIDEAHDGHTLRSVLQSELKFSRRLVRNLKLRDGVLVNGQPARLKSVVHKGDKIHITLPDEETHIEAEPMDLDIRYEDDEVVVVNKPPGMLSHPSSKERTGTLLGGLTAYLAPAGQVPHAVHRLDRDTSGVILYAKHSHAHHLFDRALRSGWMHRTYCAVVYHKEAFVPLRMGEWQTIDLPIAPDPNTPTRRVVAAGGQRAVTHYQALASTDQISVVQIVLETGRTHQIRVHFAAVDMPLVGDRAYGGPVWRRAERDPAAAPLLAFPRQALHALQLMWKHPVTGEVKRVTAPPPEDMRTFWREAGGDPRVWDRLMADPSAVPPGWRFDLA
ncbi:RluA family pseudouridine synthase [Alicyclobacillus macrosporangiidus]|uniref:RluA family pseudouridine synthase n=1 Tax=Alicyclobacillus macrosporangiidus TaxID=392015 RepID=UPI00068CB6B7|nr:RluA family pseudouridine synthase [Alicyclobacillus macrosporangiidus]